MKQIIEKYVTRDFPRLLVWSIVVIFTAGTLWAVFKDIPVDVLELKKEAVDCRVARAKFETRLDDLPEIKRDVAEIKNILMRRRYGTER